MRPLHEILIDWIGIRSPRKQLLAIFESGLVQGGKHSDALSFLKDSSVARPLLWLVGISPIEWISLRLSRAFTHKLPKCTPSGLHGKQSLGKKWRMRIQPFCQSTLLLRKPAQTFKRYYRRISYLDFILLSLVWIWSSEIPVLPLTAPLFPMLLLSQPNS